MTCSLPSSGKRALCNPIQSEIYFDSLWDHCKQLGTSFFSVGLCSIVCISTSSVTSFSFVRISATGYLLSSLSYLVSRYTAGGRRIVQDGIKGLTCRRVATFFSSLPPGKSRRIYNRNVHRSFDPVLFLFLNYLLINGTNPISVQTWKNKSAISIRANLKNVGNNLAICKAEELRSKN